MIFTTAAALRTGREAAFPVIEERQIGAAVTSLQISDIFDALGAAAPKLKEQKNVLPVSFERPCRIHPDKVILQYDIRQKLKNMASRGLVTGVFVWASPNATAWMITKG
ncbi:hypothetical protein KCP74_18190 [Salmonella enterica subsp. enterica]|nr:hypothetical protein KCP74_18190 [Salmonella enterica subsp. enterica]